MKAGWRAQSRTLSSCKCSSMLKSMEHRASSFKASLSLAQPTFLSYIDKEHTYFHKLANPLLLNRLSIALPLTH